MSNIKKHCLSSDSLSIIVISVVLMFNSLTGLYAIADDTTPSGLPGEEIIAADLDRVGGPESQTYGQAPDEAKEEVRQYLTELFARFPIEKLGIWTRPYQTEAIICQDIGKTIDTLVNWAGSNRPFIIRPVGMTEEEKAEWDSFVGGGLSEGSADTATGADLVIAKAGWDFDNPSNNYADADASGTTGGGGNISIGPGNLEEQKEGLAYSPPYIAPLYSNNPDSQVIDLVYGGKEGASFTVFSMDGKLLNRFFMPKLMYEEQLRPDVAIGDVDNDNACEIVAMHIYPAGNINEIYIFDADTNKTRSFDTYKLDGAIHRNIAMADINGDGYQDIVLGSSRWNEKYVISAVDISKDAPVLIDTWQIDRRDDRQWDTTDLKIVLADIDGDNLLELIIPVNDGDDIKVLKRGIKGDAAWPVFLHDKGHTGCYDGVRKEISLPRQISLTNAGIIMTPQSKKDIDIAAAEIVSR